MSTRVVGEREAQGGLRDAVPPLESGDHLSRDEFERRYDATPGRGGQYEPLPRLDGIIRSEVFPGLWLAPDHLINRRRTALAALQQGLSSPEYAAFVSRLRAAGAE